MGVPEEELCLYDTWDENVLGGILKTQRAVVEHQKKKKASERTYGIEIVVDYFADGPQVMSSRAGGAPSTHPLPGGTIWRHLAIY